MEWPSERIPHGGIFHPAKASYNPETKQFLNLLVEESKMSTMQRDKLKYFLRNGEPLTTTRSTGKLSSRKTPPVLIRPGSPRRRTRDTIVKMGAYEREKFVPQPIVDREEAKRRLQDLLAFGKDGEPNTQKVRNKKKEKKDDDFCNNRFEELMKEIQDREEWLAEMEELGEGKKYRQIIQDQIQARLREMEKLKTAPENSNEGSKDS